MKYLDQEKNDNFYIDKNKKRNVFKRRENVDKAYDFLVAQAEGCSWINVSCTKRVSMRAKRNRALKDAINKRLRDNTISQDNRKNFEELKTWLDSLPTV